MPFIGELMVLMKNIAYCVELYAETMSSQLRLSKALVSMWDVGTNFLKLLWDGYIKSTSPLTTEWRLINYNLGGIHRFNQHKVGSYLRVLSAYLGASSFPLSCLQWASKNPQYSRKQKQIRRNGPLHEFHWLRASVLRGKGQGWD